MKVLIISPDLEEPIYRGIQSVTKNLIKVFKTLGYEVYLLTGGPYLENEFSSDAISSKLNVLYMQHYFKRGRPFFKNFSQLSILRSAIWSILGYNKVMKVDESFKHPDLAILRYVDYLLHVPFIYQYINRGVYPIANYMLNNVVNKHKFDVVLTTSQLAVDITNPGTKLVEFAYDLMPLELIEYPFTPFTLKFAKNVEISLRNADLILSDSEDTKTKLLEINPKANIETVYLFAPAYNSELKGMDDEVNLKKFGLEKEKFLFFVSTLDERKNVHRLIQAYASISDQIDMPLVIAGSKGDGYELLMKAYRNLNSQVQAKVKIVGYVTEGEKITLMRNAYALTFPTIYEGFGIPVLEAYTYGCPAVVSRRGALPEAAGDGALYVEDPYDVSEIGATVLRLCQNRELRDELGEKGREYAKRFSSENFTKNVANAISNIH